MPTDRRNQKKFAKRPWHARAQYKGVVHHIGYFVTKEEAATAEEEFKKELRRMEEA